MLHHLPARALASAGVLALVAASSACPQDTDVKTYHRDVAPLFQRECVQCHQDGGIGPTSLVSYADAKPQAQAIATLVAARKMPPFVVDASGACNTFQDARYLTDDEIATIVAWAEQDAPEGEPPVEPPSIPPPDSLTDSTHVVTMAEAYTPKAQPDHPSDDYRCFIVDPELAADGYLTGMEIVPGQPSEVHHMLLFALLDDAAETDAQAADDGDEGPGFECFSAPFDSNSMLIAGWAPGNNVTRYPDGTGLFMAGGHKLVMQIHYNLLAGAIPDVTSVQLRVAPSVQKEAMLAPIVDTDLHVPAGEPRANFAFSTPLVGLLDELDVFGVFPHMHQLGTDMRFDLQPLGDTDPEDAFCMVDVPRWDFHWQQVFFYEQPIRITAADVLNVSCNYDTTARTDDVFWGEGTQEEMCLVFVYIARPGGGPILDAFPD